MSIPLGNIIFSHYFAYVLALFRTSMVLTSCTVWLRYKKRVVTDYSLFVFQ